MSAGDNPIRPAGPAAPNASAAAAVAAVLDLDYTLIPRTSVERMFVRYLWEEGELGWRDLLRVGRNLLMEGEGPVALRIKTNKAYLADRPVQAYQQRAVRFVADRVQPAISPRAVAVLKNHQERGHLILLLTGCPEFLARPVAESLEIGWVIGTRLEEKDGVWTGRLIPPHPYGEAKRRLMEPWARDQAIRLERSYAYADSPADLALLEAVGHPQVVNPGREMRRVASEKGWPILKW